MDCQFSLPQNYQGVAPSSGEPFAFSFVSCNDTQIFELIENGTTGSEFYINKTIDYGEILILIFLSMALFYVIATFFWRWIFQKNI